MKMKLFNTKTGRKVFRIFTLTSGKIMEDSMPARMIHKNINDPLCRPAVTGRSSVALQAHGGQSKLGHGEPSDTLVPRLVRRSSNEVLEPRWLTEEVLESKI